MCLLRVLSLGFILLGLFHTLQLLLLVFLDDLSEVARPIGDGTLRVIHRNQQSDRLTVVWSDSVCLQSELTGLLNELDVCDIQPETQLVVFGVARGRCQQEDVIEQVQPTGFLCQLGVSRFGGRHVA